MLVSGRVTFFSDMFPGGYQCLAQHGRILSTRTKVPGESGSDVGIGSDMCSEIIRKIWEKKNEKTSGLHTP